jgi:AAA domain/CHC2 zinc finger
MAFDQHQLDEIRARIPVSEVVGRKFKLRKQGNEFVAVDDQSLTVNDQKGLWYDFGKGDGGGDIFDFLQTHEGYKFVDAVEELAKKAGVTLKNGAGRAAASSHRNGAASASDSGPDRMREADAPPPRDDRPDDGVSSARGKRELVAVWDYVDPEMNLLYQVVRMQERMPDGEWRRNREGKIWKTFMQRRPSPEGDGTWILGLDFVDRESGQPLEFIKTPNSQAWLRATDERRQWNGVTVRTFEGAGNVDHWLYNANAVIDELQEPKEDQRTIFLPEGEGKVDILKEWGLLGVTNSGGAKHFTKECAEFFRNARHVVLLQDNDRAGAERVAKIAPMLKAVDVELVQVLNFHDVWPKCPIKGDIKDWRDQGGGTKDGLLEIVDGLKQWTPEPYQSKFGAKTADFLGTAARAYPWRIKGIMPMHDNMLVMGPSRSGKTFEVLDMIMHVMRGEPFAGRKVIPCGFIYLTYEGATGFENRLRAYLLHHGLTPADFHSFAWLTRPPNLFASEDNVVALADEINKIAETFKLPLGGIVIDTHNAATRGSTEIRSEDINKILTNYETIREKTGAPLIVIGHTNSEGRHRGSDLIFNNIETAVLVERVYTDAKKTIEKRDDDGRTIRRGKISKQREGDDRTQWEFVLEKVKIGVDEDGDDIDSMVSVDPARQVPADVTDDIKRDRPDGFYLSGNNVDVFRALLKAVENTGKPAPPQLGLPQSVGNVIRWVDLGIEYKKTDPQEQDEPLNKYRDRIKKRLKRFREDLMKYSVIGIGEIVVTEPVGAEVDKNDPESMKPRTVHYVWPTGKRVYGKGLQWPSLPPKKKNSPQGDMLPPDTEGM